MNESITIQDLETVLRVLRLAAGDVSRFDDSLEFKSLVAKINRQARQRNGRETRQQLQLEDRQTKAVALEHRGEFGADSGAEPGATRDMPPLTLHKSRRCYICKTPYRTLQRQYHLLCETCASLNAAKRVQRCDLHGRVALVTGGRIKIGFQLALKLLRDGARVIVTTRFPQDAAERFAAQSDFADWSDRLELHGLDLRHLGAVQSFIIDFLRREAHLDMLINNAAQTISRPLEFHAHLLERENSARLSALVRSPMQLLSVPLELAATAQYFPPDAYDADGQALDQRPANSWIQKLHEVPTRDLLEVHIVNFVAPFMLCAGLKPGLERSPFTRRFIVNVSAMEGQFSRASKGVHHPHTNAAKAALNMLTRTSGTDYATKGIFMTAVDTGWITDENPFPKAARMRDNGFAPPLNAVDGAARIYDPIVSGLNQSGTPFYGVFLKNYQPYPW